MKQLTSNMLVEYDLVLQAAKNKDYGNSFDTTCDRFGPIVMCIRLHDKISRLKRLSNGEANVKNESMFDTWLDAVNYALMSYAWLASEDTAECFRTTLSNKFTCLQLSCFEQGALEAADACDELNSTISEQVEMLQDHDDDSFAATVEAIKENLLNIADIAFRQCLQYNDSMLDKRYVKTVV